MQSWSPPKHTLNAMKTIKNRTPQNNNNKKINLIFLLLQKEFCTFRSFNLLRVLPSRSEIWETPLFPASVWRGVPVQNVHGLNSDHYWNQHNTEISMKQIHKFGWQCTKTSKLKMVTDSRHCVSRCLTLSPELKSRHYGFCCCC